MKNETMGLLCLALIASVSFAQPADYDLFVKTGGALRYVGPEVTYPHLAFPMAHPDQYREMEFSQIRYSMAVFVDCPKENGMPICG